MNTKKAISDAFNQCIKQLPESIKHDVEADRYKYLTDVRLLFNEKQSGKFLDVAGARGANCLMLRELGDFDLHIVDRFDRNDNEIAQKIAHPSRLFYTEQGVKISECDVSNTRLPYEDNSFDLISAVDLIEHFSRSGRFFLLEMRRILKPDGRLLIGCPNICHLQNRIKLMCGASIHPPVKQWYKQCFYQGHIREYSKKELVWLLTESGLNIEKLRMGEEELLSVIFDFKKLQRHRKQDALNTISLKNPADIIFYIYASIYFSVVSVFPGLRYFIRIVASKDKAG